VPAEEVLRMDTITPAPGSLAEALAQIPDPRRSHLRVHGLVALLQMAVAAMLCGSRSLYAIAQWGQERREDDPALLVDLGLKPGRSPSVATLHRVFRRLGVACERGRCSPRCGRGRKGRNCPLRRPRWRRWIWPGTS